MPIPKIIHQIWFQGENNIPNKYLPYIKQLHEYHPSTNNQSLLDDSKQISSWQYIFWDDIKIIKLLEQNKIWIDTYYKLTYLHQKVDYARYIILYLYGGIYIDMDVIIVKPLDSLLDELKDYDFVVSKINMGWFENMVCCGRSTCINNGIIMAEPKVAILEKIIDFVNQHSTCSSLTKFGCINNTTGPKAFTNVILSHLNDKIKILEPEYLEPQVLGTGHITNNTYAIHEHDGTWLSQWFRQVGAFYMKNKMKVIVVF